jgi:hypothetical protein
MPTLFFSPMPLWCCGLKCPWGLRTVAAACSLGVCDRSGCPLSGASRVGGALLQQRHLWLVDPPPSVCEMVWRVMVLAAIWAMEQDRKLWSLVHPPPRQVSAVQQAVSKAPTQCPPPSGLPCMILPGMIDQSQLRAGMKSALIIFYCLFASRFPYARAYRLCFPISIDGVLFPCFDWQALYSTSLRFLVSLRLASMCLLLCPALLVSVHLAWLVAWFPVQSL